MKLAKTEIRCKHCNSEKVIKWGNQTNGSPRYKCKSCEKVFQLEYLSNGSKPEIKKLIIKMSLNGSGIRDISRVLGTSSNTVTSVLKKLKNFGHASK
jgi:transposase-like protein